MYLCDAPRDRVLLRVSAPGTWSQILNFSASVSHPFWLFVLQMSGSNSHSMANITITKLPVSPNRGNGTKPVKIDFTMASQHHAANHPWQWSGA